jgi:hypothetical protein
LDSLCGLTLSRGIGLAKPALRTVPCPAVDKLYRDMPNKAAAELDRLHDRTVNPVFASYERTSEAIRAKCRQTLATPPPLFTRYKA